MSRRQDGLEALKATNPINPDQVNRPDSPRAEALLSEILTTPRRIQETASRSQQVRRKAVAWALAALGLIAAAVYFTRPIDVPNAVLCYADTNLDADIGAAPAGGPATASACEPVWEAGDLTNPTVTPGEIPPLTACVNTDGILAVFPTDNTNICDQLGLAHPDEASQSDADTIRQVEDNLITYFTSSDCIPSDEAETYVEQVLVQAGLEDWTIQTQPPHPNRPCTSFGLDGASNTIHLVPIPPPER